MTKILAAINDTEVFVSITYIFPSYLFSLLGEFEVLLRLPTYIQTVTCVEKVETFELDFTSFTRLIAKKNPNTYNHMHQLAEMKLASRVERFKKEQVSTLGPVVIVHPKSGPKSSFRRHCDINAIGHRKLQVSDGPWRRDPGWARGKYVTGRTRF